MRIVDHDARTVLLGKTADLRQICNVARHGEHAVGHDQAAGRFRNLLELLLQIFHVVVAEAEHFPVGKAAAVIEARVVFAIHDAVLVPTDNGADDAEVGLEPGRERDDAGLAEDPGQLRFEFQVQRQRPVQEAGAGAAGAELLIGFDARLNDLGVCGESKIVVRTEHDAALALHDDLDVLLRFERRDIWINAKALGLGGERRFCTFFKQIDHCQSPFSVSTVCTRACMTRSAASSSSGEKRPASASMASRSACSLSW